MTLVDEPITSNELEGYLDEPADAMYGTIVCTGSRTWNRRDIIRSVLTAYRAVALPRQVVIHGAADGADKMVGQEAESLGYEVEAMPAVWRPGGVYDSRAGLIRNLRMLDRNPDLVIAFRNGVTTGTAHCVSEAKRRGIMVYEVWL